MATWKSAFVAVLMSGMVIGVLTGHLALWTAIGAALGAVMASRERHRSNALYSDCNHAESRDLKAS